MAATVDFFLRRMGMMGYAARVGMLGLIWVLGVRAGFGQQPAASPGDPPSVPAANPARPTVTIPAALPPTGYLQIEQGFVRAGDSPGGVTGQTGINQVTKIAVTGHLTVQLLSQPYAYSSVLDGSGRTVSTSDPGDLQVGIQGVVRRSQGAVPTVSAGFIRRVRAGTSASLDVGEYSQSALVLLGGDLRDGFHYDSNLLWNEINDGAVRRGQMGQTLAVTHGLFPKATKQRLSGIVELSHFTQPLVKASRNGGSVARANAVDLLFAGTWTARPNLIFDASMERGLTSTSTAWQGGLGVSYLLPWRLGLGQR